LRYAALRPHRVVHDRPSCGVDARPTQTSLGHECRLLRHVLTTSLHVGEVAIHQGRGFGLAPRLSSVNLSEATYGAVYEELRIRQASP